MAAAVAGINNANKWIMLECLIRFTSKLLHSYDNEYNQVKYNCSASVFVRVKVIIHFMKWHMTSTFAFEHPKQLFRYRTTHVCVVIKTDVKNGKQRRKT